MVRKPSPLPTAKEWDAAIGLLPCSQETDAGLQGALVPDSAHNSDHIAVVYDKGDTPPEITIQEVSGSVQTVLANGVAVAVVANSNGPGLSVQDVLLVERST